MWAWGPTLTQVAKDFKKETGINVNLVNTGQGNKTWDEFYQDARRSHPWRQLTTSRPTPVAPASTTR